MTTTIIGNSFKASFPGYTFKLDFHSETSLTWVQMNDDGSLGTPMTVDITRVEIRPDVFMVYWTEPSLGNSVTHLQDFENAYVWTNITLKDGTFLNLSGPLNVFNQAEH